jgi:hypothetical protein
MLSISRALPICAATRGARSAPPVGDFGERIGLAQVGIVNSREPRVEDRRAQTCEHPRHRFTLKNSPDRDPHRHD